MTRRIMMKTMMKTMMKIMTKTMMKTMTRTMMKITMKTMTRTMMKTMTKTMTKITMRIWMRMLMDHPDVVKEAVVEAVAVEEDLAVEVVEAVVEVAVPEEDLAEDLVEVVEEPAAQLAQLHHNHLEPLINKFTAEDFLEEPAHQIPDLVPIEDMMLIVVTSKINVNLPSQCTNHHPICAVPPEEAELANLAFHTDLCHSIPAEQDLHHAVYTEMFFKTADQSPPWNLNHVLWLVEVLLM
jgi:hypothetical protein